MPSTALTAEPLSLAWWFVTRHIPAFTLSMMTAARGHHAKRLARLLRLLSQAQGKLLPHDGPISDNAKRLLDTFFRLRVWYYTADQRCLFDSLVLAVFLTKNAIPCVLMIGVATKPFSAHAWVQIGDTVVNDTVDHVHLFTPILAVGGGQ